MAGVVPMTEGDAVANTALETYRDLPKKGKPNKDTEWTVLAAIVQELNGDLKTVALGTGSKCLGSGKVVNNGTVLNDSHAEVICRRAFFRYLLADLHRTVNDTGSTKLRSIFERDRPSSKWRIRSDIKFHFYVSQAPCGDAAVFEVDRSVETCSQAKRRRTEGAAEGQQGSLSDDSKIFPEHDLHRTGAKSVPGAAQDKLGSGIDYHVVGVLRTKPGRGDPTCSMSCSDKICRWNVLGWQGGLLASVMDPVYMETIVIAEMFEKTAVERALLERLPIIELPPKFYCTKPKIIQCKSRFCHSKSMIEESYRLRQVGIPTNIAACGISIGWACNSCDTDLHQHLLDTSNYGRKQGLSFKKQLTSLKLCSKLSRQAVIAKLLEVTKLLQKSEIPASGTDSSEDRYISMKNKCDDYCKARDALHRARPFDAWVGNPKSVQEFVVFPH